jgi:hypothetical protein
MELQRWTRHFGRKSNIIICMRRTEGNQDREIDVDQIEANNAVSMTRCVALDGASFFNFFLSTKGTLQIARNPIGNDDDGTIPLNRGFDPPTAFSTNLALCLF